MLNSSLQSRPTASRVLAWCLTIPLLCSGSPGQTGAASTPEQAPKTAPKIEEALPSYEGQNVSSVELAGQPDLKLADFTPLLKQKVGEPFARAKVEDSIAALKENGGFQTVELEVRPETDGLRVIMILQPAVYFGVYEFPGATSQFSYSRLLQVADYPPRGAYTPVDVRNAQTAIETFFQRNGFFRAQVQPEIQTDKIHGIANVLFHVTLNRRAKFGKVTITGPSPGTREETLYLEHALHSLVARARSSSIRSGKTYSLKTLQNATQFLEAQLTKQNRLEAKVKLIGAAYDPQTNRADITFKVVPGPVVRVKVQGAHLWSWSRRRLLPIYEQNGMDPELIQEGRQNLISYFQAKGYFDAKVDARVEGGGEAGPEAKAGQGRAAPSAPHAEGGNVREETVLYQITKGSRHKVESIKIVGNQHLDEDDLLPQVQVRRAHFFSHGKYSDKIVRDSVNRLTRLYQANGFSSVHVAPQVATDKGNLAATFRVNEGPQDIVETMRISGNDTVPEGQLAPNGLKVLPGQPYSTKHVDEDRNAIMANYLNRGYLTASFRQIARPIAGDKHKLEVVYQIYEGPRVETASVVTLGRQHSQQGLIDKTVAMDQGRSLREDGLLSSESRLYNLGVFDWAEIDPRRQITTQSKEDVVVKVHEAKRNQLLYGIGFEVANRGGSLPSGTVALPGLPPVGVGSNFKSSQKTYWGPRGSIEYTRKNVRGRAETFTIAALAARLDQRASFNFGDPYFFHTDWSSNFTVSGERSSQNPIFTSRLAEASFQVQRALNADKTENLFLRYSLRQTGLTQVLIPDLVPSQDLHVRLSTLSATFTRDTRDNVLDAHKGIYETGELDFNPRSLGSSANFARFLGQTAYYRNIGGGVVWANSLRIGLEQPLAGGRVPLSEEFFSGGASTLRGFSLNGAGPQRALRVCSPVEVTQCSNIVVPVGGNQLLIINSELRIPVPIKKGLGIAAFYDGGNIFRRIGFHDFAANYTNTLGIGLRYSTPVGPVRIDVGHIFNPPNTIINGTPGISNASQGIKTTQVFVTLGQSF